MATVYVNIGRAGANGSSSDAPVRKTTVQSCAAYTSSATAGYVQSGGRDAELQVGQIVDVVTDGAVVVRFDGVATAAVGHRIGANTTTTPATFQCDKDGQKISIIDQ